MATREEISNKHCYDSKTGKKVYCRNCPEAIKLGCKKSTFNYPERIYGECYGGYDR